MNKKRTVILSLALCSVSAITIGVLAAFNKKGSTDFVKATDEKTITWTKDTAETAYTSLGNSVTLGSRYSGEWTFGGEYFASTSTTNSFIDNFTEVTNPFQSIKAITVTYTYDTAPLFMSLFLTNDYSASACARISEVESGKRYEIGVSEFDYIYTSSSDVFRWFYLNSPSGTTNISSLVIEYTCN